MASHPGRVFVRWRLKLFSASERGLTDYGLHTDYGLPPDLALDRIAGLRILLRPDPGNAKSFAAFEA
eukprot:11204101-Alexandrium_andersonii.AAC.1